MLNHLAAPYFVEQVRRLATTRYGDTELFRGGLVFYVDARHPHAGGRRDRAPPRPRDPRSPARLPRPDRRDRRRRSRGVSPEGPAHRYRPGAPEGDLTLGDAILARRHLRRDDHVAAKNGAVDLDLGPLELPLVAADTTDVRALEGQEDRQGGRRRRSARPVRVAADGKSAVLAQPPALQGALVAMEPSTGRVRRAGRRLRLVDQRSSIARPRPSGRSARRSSPSSTAAALAHGHTSVDSPLRRPGLRADRDRHLVARRTTTTSTWAGSRCAPRSRARSTRSAVQLARRARRRSPDRRACAASASRRRSRATSRSRSARPISRCSRSRRATPASPAAAAASSRASSTGHRRQRHHRRSTSAPPARPAGAHARGRVHDRRHDEGVIQRGTARRAAELPAARRRQDRHVDQLQGRLVHRLHARSAVRRVDRPRRLDADRRQDHRRRRRGPDLARLHEERAPADAGPRLPGAARRHVRARRRVERRSRGPPDRRALGPVRARQPCPHASPAARGTGSFEDLVPAPPVP